MSLREELKEWIPKLLWDIINHPHGYTVTSEEFNNQWNLIVNQNDDQAHTIRKLLTMLYETLLNDEDGSFHLKVGLPDRYATDNLRQVLILIDERLKADAQNLLTHKTSGDHDGRYFTEQELLSGQLDSRYYTKQEMTQFLRGGDTSRKEEVFIIVNPNNGDGTFTYKNHNEIEFIGELLGDGSQVFELQEGYYEPNNSRIEAIVGDTLRRSAKSGGLIETSNTSFALTAPEGVGAEITVIYYERLGMAAEYNIKVSPTKPPANDGKTMWFKVEG